MDDKTFVIGGGIFLSFLFILISATAILPNWMDHQSYRQCITTENVDCIQILKQ